MNFLAHHAVALSRATRGDANDAAPAFYVGNVLPDLIAMSGDPRVRTEHLAQTRSPLAAGMALHFESDRRFHKFSAFAEAQADVKALLLSAPFAEPPARTYFLAHVFVEIALDSHILLETPEIARDFYARLELANPEAIVFEVQSILGTDKPLTALSGVLTRFVRNQYLYEYAEAEGCADALHQISRRAGLTGFPSVEARETLAILFDSFRRPISDYAPQLLAVNPDTQSWYNSDEFAPDRGVKAPL